MEKKLLHFKYKMKISYTEPVARCWFTIKCCPRDDMRQSLQRIIYSMKPDSGYSESIDAYGNHQIYGCVDEPHDTFVFTAEGETAVSLASEAEMEDENKTGLFRFPHGKCKDGSAIREYSDRLKHSAPSAETARDQCIRIMNSLHNDFIYEKNVTDINTDAESAWRVGRGVCQDFAHIYITLLRLAGIPARYVCGLIDGEGESHAWVESLIDGVWTGFDPTNNCEASGTYIKLSIGRDASECAVNRGIVMGGGVQTQLISAQVCEVR